MDKRLAYAIPNLFTAGSLICALVALNLVTIGSYIQAAWLITISIVLDGFDGKMARILNSMSKLGAQADSLADFVAFGVAPGFLAWQISLKNFGFIGFFVFIVYVLCGGFRLARYNVLSESFTKKTDFMGLPIPAAAAAVVSLILFNEIVLQDIDGHFLILISMALMSWLMVSKIPYIAINKSRKKKKYFSLIVILVVAMSILAIKHTAWFYLVCAWLYILYGLYNKIKLIIHKYHEKHVNIRHKT